MNSRSKILSIARTVVLLFLFCSIAVAQRGKIYGTITDADTKEPLFGVNVLIKNTQQGASSDIDGNYVIQNVPPGTYSLVASMIGYNQTVVNKVAVSIEHSTTVDILMRSSTVELGAVIVEAQQAVVVKDRTATATTINGRDVERAPVEGLRDVMELNAGIHRSASGNLSTRGSGAYEISVLVNGVEQMTSNTGMPGFSAALGDKGENSWKSDINPLAVQQVEIISGGSTAEYGNAQAGSVKVATREGEQKLSGQFKIEYRPPGQYHWGEYIYGTNSIEWQKWGTLEGWRKNLDSATIFNSYLKDPVTGVIKDSLNGQLMTVDKWRELMWHQWVVNHTPADDNQLGAYDYRRGSYNRILFNFGGPLGSNPDLLRFFLAGEYRSAPTRLPTVEKTQTRQEYILSVMYKPVQTHKLRFVGMYQSFRGGLASSSEDIRWAGRDGSYKYYLVTDSPREEYTTSQSVEYTYTISGKSFLNVLANHQFEKYNLVLNPVPQPAANWRNVVYNNWWLMPVSTAWDEGYRTIYSFTTFYQQDLRNHFYQLNADYTNQLSKYHDIKLGLRASYWAMINSAVYSSFAATAYITRTGYAEYYKSYPRSFAFFIQDKMEFEGLVANVGGRYDYYNFNALVPANRFAPFYIAEYQAGGPAGDPRVVQSKGFSTFSPRLGLSFPIGEHTAFRMSYGHFTSMPIWKQAYAGTNELGWATYGNPNLAPKKTIKSEFGVQHSFGGSHRLDLVGYYEDRINQIANLRIKAVTGDIRREFYYTTYENNQFGASKGVEVILEKITPDRFTYRLSYSLSRTTYGNYGSTKIESDDPDDPRNFKDPYAPTDYLSSDDRTHTFRALLTYAIEKGGGINLSGFKPLENVTVSMVYNAQSGSPYTFVPDYDPLIDEYRKDRVSNNRRFPLEAKTDLSLFKSFDLFGMKAEFGVRIKNLFDNQWLTPLDYKTQQLTDWVMYGLTMDNPLINDPANAAFYAKDVYKFNYFKAYRNMPRETFFVFGFSF